MKKYKIILADPPWNYNDSGVRGGVDHHYPSMPLYKIRRLDVRSIADDNCALFLWVTWPFLFEAQEVIKSWGFYYKTLAFIWVKINKNNKKPFMGCGHWTRANSEICLLATKGRPVRIDASVSSVVIRAREEHSKKPDIVRKRIVKLLGDLPRLEMFAREKTEGWDVWGNEVDSEVEL